MSEPISFSLALELIEKAARAWQRKEVERVSIEDCVGRISARDLTSNEILPAFDTSAMDGFAVRAHETLHASPTHPLEFHVRGSLAAGDSFTLEPSSSSQHAAWEIMTGAGFPPGTDACIRLEDVEWIENAKLNEKKIRIRTPVQAGANRRLAGEDFQVGSKVLSRFQKLRAEDCLVLASLGITEVEVFKSLRVALIATGKELVSPNEKPTPPQIRNSTTVYLQSALWSRGIECRVQGSIGDDEALFLEKVKSAINDKFDVILTTGAISVGRYDFVLECLNRLGFETHFQKVKIRPGKPLLFGQLHNGPFVMGLPGNPVATATGFRFFVDPLLRFLDGQQPEVPFIAPLMKATKKAAGATCFLKGALSLTSEGQPTVEAHGNQKASITQPLLTANSWIKIDASPEDEIPAGTLVHVYPF